PVQYAKRVRGTRMYSGGSTFIPLRVNSAGVIPIIFAISILLLPSQVAQYFTNSDTDWLKNISSGIVAAFGNPIFYNSLYFVLVVGVVVETMKQLAAQLLPRSYEGLIR